MREGHEALIKAFESTNGPIRESYAARMGAADLQAWLAMAEDRNGVEDLLAKMQFPCCVYAGDADPEFSNAKETSDCIPRASFVALPGLSHMQAFYASDVVVPVIENFLAP